MTACVFFFLQKWILAGICRQLSLIAFRSVMGTSVGSPEELFPLCEIWLERLTIARLKRCMI